MIQATGLVLISNEKQVSHYNGKKSFFSINSTHSKFLKMRIHKRKSIERKGKHHSHHLSFLQTYIFKSFKKNHLLKIKFFKVLLELYWSNFWYTISVSILYTTTLWESHYCIQQIICKGLIFIRKKIGNGLIFTPKKIVKLVNLGILEKWSWGRDVGEEAESQ